MVVNQALMKLNLILDYLDIPEKVMDLTGIQINLGYYLVVVMTIKFVFGILINQISYHQLLTH